MPARFKIPLVGVILVLLPLAGCIPTSKSAELSALSQDYSQPSRSATVQPSATALPDPQTSPAASQIPTLTPSPQPASTLPVCQDARGKIVRQEIDSSYLKEPFEFRIYLPPCFSDSADAAYPLLILLHGSVFTDDQWDRLGIDETADRLISEGAIAPLVILMPYEEQTLANPYQPGFGPALTSELLPWLEKEYPVCRERACRAIGGISRGAAWAVHLGFTDWQLFGSIGAHSLPPFWGDLNSLPLWLSSIPKEDRPRVFLDVGQGDPYRQPASQFEEFLTDNNIPHEWYLFNGAHDENYWGSHIEQYLRWYSAAWQKE